MLAERAKPQIYICFGQDCMYVRNVEKALTQVKKDYEDVTCG